MALILSQCHVAHIHPTHLRLSRYSVLPSLHYLIFPFSPLALSSRRSILSQDCKTLLSVHLPLTPLLVGGCRIISCLVQVWFPLRGAAGFGADSDCMLFMVMRREQKERN